MNNNDGKVAVVATATRWVRGTQPQKAAFLRESWENPVAVSPDSENPTVSFY